jgi:two-component system response regulator PilR (NtrC family)
VPDTEKISYRILVVDDEPVLLSEVIDYLNRRGERVTSAAGFTQAKRLLETETFDALISDVRMPDGNGVDLVRFQLEHSGGRCACFLVTGHLDEREVADLTAVKHFYKPFSLGTLYREVRAELDRRRLAGGQP